jgi:phage shock protein C
MEKISPPYKKLWRSRYNKKIAGVCGGLATYFSVDPFWMRLIFIIFLLAGGSAFLVYVIMWLLIPLEPLNLEH